jgi:hypothetical protein
MTFIFKRGGQSPKLVTFTDLPSFQAQLGTIVNILRSY